MAMVPHTADLPEIALPAALLPALWRAMTLDAGEDAAAMALSRAGKAAGEAFHHLLIRRASAVAGQSLAAAEQVMLGDVPESRFWKLLSEIFADRGWGRLEHVAVHPGVGALDSSDWAEADPASATIRPSCHFTAGLLARLLSRAANGGVRVIETECRSRGDLRCRFLFGGESALRRIDEALALGRDCDAVLADLV